MSDRELEVERIAFDKVESVKCVEGVKDGRT